jgi:hypothetical protein
MSDITDMQCTCCYCIHILCTLPILADDMSDDMYDDNSVSRHMPVSNSSRVFSGHSSPDFLRAQASHSATANGGGSSATNAAANNSNAQQQQHMHASHFVAPSTAHAAQYTNTNNMFTR